MRDTKCWWGNKNEKALEEKNEWLDNKRCEPGASNIHPLYFVLRVEMRDRVINSGHYKAVCHNGKDVGLCGNQET